MKTLSSATCTSAAYTDYKDMGGAEIPGRIVQKRGGWPFFEVTVTSGSANPANLTVLMTPPAPAGGKGGAAKGDGKAASKGGLPPPPGAAGAPGASSEKIEFKDYIVVLEGPQSDAREPRSSPKPNGFPRANPSATS